MSMNAYGVVVVNQTTGQVLFVPNNNTNLAQMIFVALQANQAQQTAPSATVTAPSLPSSGPMFTVNSTTLASNASAGDMSVVLASVTQLAVGSSLQFADNGEKATVGPAYIVGSTTVPLLQPLVGGHAAGVSVSYFTSALVPGGTSVNPNAPVSHSPGSSADIAQKQALAGMANAIAQSVILYFQLNASVTGTTDTTVSNANEPLKNGVVS